MLKCRRIMPADKICFSTEGGGGDKMINLKDTATYSYNSVFSLICLQWACLVKMSLGLMAQEPAKKSK